MVPITGMRRVAGTRSTEADAILGKNGESTRTINIGTGQGP
jgi:hypothetical protein